MNKLVCKVFFSGFLFTNIYGGELGSDDFSTEPSDLAESSNRGLVSDAQPPLEDLILEEICALCEREGFNERDPFCLTYNLRNIRQVLTSYTSSLNLFFSTANRNQYSDVVLCDIICQCINSCIKESLKISHFGLQLKSDETRKEKACEFVIEDHYVKIKIPDFWDNSKIEQFKYGFYEVVGKQKGIIVDLRDNLGGRADILHYFLLYFFNENIILNYFISRKHEQFFGEMSPWKKQHSKQELKELIATIESNWKLKDKQQELWKINPYPSGHSIVQKNIAILINERSASCSEIFTLTLKGHYPDRVKVIGQKSAGELLVASNSYPLSCFSGLSLNYPFEEVIGVDGTRVEGVGIEPDIVSNDEEEIMKAAINWVTQG